MGVPGILMFKSWGKTLGMYSPPVAKSKDFVSEKYWLYILYC